MAAEFVQKIGRFAAGQRITFYALLVFWCSLGFSSALAEISFVTALICWALERVILKKVALPAPRAVLLSLAGFIIICAASVLWSEHSPTSFRGLFKYIQHGLLFVMTLDCFDHEKRQKQFENVFAVFFAVLILNGMVQYFYGKDLIRGFSIQDASAGKRLASSFKAYGLYAAYLIATIPFAVSLTFSRFRKKNHKTAWLYLLFTALALVSLFLTRSRGAMLALGTGTIFFLIYRRQWKWLALIIAGGLLVLFLMPRSMVIHLDAEGKEQSIVERGVLWRRAADVVIARPLTGTGVNTYAVSHQKYDTRKSWRVQNYYAHNGYLQMAAEIGLPGLIFFLSFLFFYFTSSIRRIQAALPDQRIRHYGLLAGMANFLLLVSVDTVLHSMQTVLVFWYLAGIQMAYLRCIDPLEKSNPVNPQMDGGHGGKEWR